MFCQIMTAHFLIGKPGVTRLAGHGFVVFPSGWPRQNNTGTFPVDKPRYATSCVTGPKGISFAPFGKAGAVQAQNWDKPRRVISKIEWPPDELFPRVCLIVTNLPMEPDRLARFCNQPGTAEQHINPPYSSKAEGIGCVRLKVL